MTRKYRAISPTTIVEGLEVQRQLFGQQPAELIKAQEDKVTQFLTLWTAPDRESQRWVRRRARTLLESVYNETSMGIDVFLLCTQSASVTRLARIDPIICKSHIQKWWSKVEHPQGLSFAGKACESRHWSVFSKFRSQPPPTAVQLTLFELFKFLETKSSCQSLRMICHLSGQPLPTIDLDIDGRGAKIELSLRASEALIQHLVISRGFADGSIGPQDVDKTGKPDLAV
ncbi:hypothetical protein BDV29DRAFT_186580 [Aspergillus leporis]|uniref:Uncharacterized protein n=1 Tax=Aspergillus leporis TaxID=41062 RepID=A0A5N5WG11_9EURO|nr:hypothetical protein BDV29DRAFT_186580 [Aspergillus leporis]